MSDDKVTANDLISMGVNLTAISRPRLYTLTEYHSHATGLVDRFEDASLNNARNAMAPTLSILDFLMGDAAGDIKFVDHYDQFASNAITVDSVVRGEAATKTLILTDAKPPNAISELSGLQPHQQALLDDLTTCLKAHLARPAIVMAWALGYDLVRSWVFNEPTRQTAFNTQLAANLRRGEPASVANYHDFFGIGEVRFLEICRDSQDATLQRFTGRTFRDLQGLLDQRNEFAHANYSQANEHEANAYVIRLVRIVTSPPFI